MLIKNAPGPESGLNKIKSFSLSLFYNIVRKNFYRDISAVNLLLNIAATLWELIVRNPVRTREYG